MGQRYHPIGYAVRFDKKADGRIIEIEGRGFKSFLLFGKKEIADIQAGQFFRIFFHVIQEIQYIAQIIHGTAVKGAVG